MNRREKGAAARRLPRTAMAAVIWLAAVCLLTFGAAEEKLSIRCENRMLSYHRNVFAVEAPEAGILTIQIQDEHHVYRMLTEQVSGGSGRVEWDGLGWNGERLNSKVYQIQSELTGESGKTYKSLFSTYVDYSAQALIFGLPSADTLYLDDPGSWFIEGKTVLNGTVLLEIRSRDGETPVYSGTKEVSGGKILKMVFSDLWEALQPGSYTARICEISNPEYDSRFPLTVEEYSPDLTRIAVTGSNMPKRGDSDEEIWRKMREPGVVVDIPYLDHQKVYDRSEETGKVLGTLHGQTQALSVFETNEDWTRIGAWNHEEGEYMEGWVPTDRLKLAFPQGRYGLLLDKKAQTLTVYEDGRPIETLLVSTGRMEKDELYQETAAGSFLTGLHRTDYSTNGQKYDFVIQYDGGNLMHQIPYAWGNNQKNFTEGRALLGSKGSHACIRVQADPGENGLNAYWLWTHIPYQTRLIILDDPEERRAEAALIQGNVPEYGEDMLVDSYMEEREEREPGIVLTFGGDAVLGGRESYLNRKDSFFASVADGDYSRPFSGLQDVIGNDDWTGMNLECALKADSTGEDTEKTWRFRGLPAYAEILPAGSVDLANVANNHTMDYGAAGFEETLASLSGKAEACGYGQLVIREIRGHLFGFGGCRETVYKQDPGIIEREIRELKERGAEIVIYQCHWGTEYAGNHNALQEAMARACVRAGADAVIGHHPHVVQGIDVIGGVPVIYSLGNCCFGGTIDLSTFDGMLVQLEFLFDGEKKTETAVRLIPILTSGAAAEGVNDYRPVIAEKEDKARIMRLVQQDTPFRLREIFPVQ